MHGLILKGIGGFYYIEKDGEIYCCKARGIFRKEKIIPLVGDLVEFTPGIGESEGSIDAILQRKNMLKRPAVANIDKLFVVVSTVDPFPKTMIIDKTIAVAEIKGIEPMIVITKTDLEKNDEIIKLYRDIGFKVFTISPKDLSLADEIKAELNGCICAFTGNSGVGKSTLLNAIFSDLSLQTGETSKKLGRGKHTTRHVELYSVGVNSYVADTPGFSNIELEKYDIESSVEVVYGFREFKEYLGQCKFNSCTHTCEKGCAVINAVNCGKIDNSRHRSYIAMYNELKGVKQW